MQQVQSEYQISHNGKSHSSPSAEKDVRKICDFLRAEKIQEFLPDRKYNDATLPARDLLVSGSAYASTNTAFKEFRADTLKAVNKGPKRAAPTQEPDEEDEEPRGWWVVDGPGGARVGGNARSSAVVKREAVDGVGEEDDGVEVLGGKDGWVAVWVTG